MERRFSATPVPNGKGLLVRLPFDPDEVWGTREVHHVRGTVAGVGVRGPVRDGALSLGPAWVRDAVLPDGIVEVVLAPEGPQSGSLAADIEAALDADPEARRRFENLATFYRKGLLRPIESAKRPETRAENLAAMMEKLRA